MLRFSVQTPGCSDSHGSPSHSFAGGTGICVRICLFFWMTVLIITARGADTFPAEVKVCFRDECEKAVCQQIREARKSILIAAYSLTSNYIVDALVDAGTRGVQVRMKIDREQAREDAAKRLVERLRRAGGSVHTIGMPAHYSMHNKFLVIDDHTVLTGSFNFTIAAATQNWENLVVIESESLAAVFHQEWENIRTRKETLRE